jgi:mannosyltransferase OCH1-like enzyme
MNIEKKITQIWIGPNPAPMAWMDTWKEKHPEWEYEIFTDQMLKDRKWMNQHLIEHYYNNKRWAGVSDLIRYELLLERGGFFPEADMECYHNTDELFTSPPHIAYTCYENELYRANFVQPILACNPGNMFVRMLVETLHQLRADQLHYEPFRSTGNEFLSKHIPMNLDKVKVWPSHYFIPQFYVRESKRYDGTDKVYAEHHWGSTGMPWTKQYSTAT